MLSDIQNNKVQLKLPEAKDQKKRSESLIEDLEITKLASSTDSARHYASEKQIS